MQEVREALATVEELDAQQLGAALRRYGVRAPETGNELSTPFPFNLMFRTSIGPKGDAIGYLRPETAQGIFVDFKCATAWEVVIYFTPGGTAVQCSVAPLMLSLAIKPAGNPAKQPTRIAALFNLPWMYGPHLGHSATCQGLARVLVW